jgi:cell division septation protein DedD
MKQSLAFITSSFRHMIMGGIILMVLGLLVQPLWAQGDAIARVVKSQGNVLLKRQVDANFTTPLQPAMDLFNGDAIRSENGGFASIIFMDDKTLLKVKDGTQFQFVDTENSRTIQMQYGTMRSTLPQPIKSFRVETPVSVASVKGTDFWLIHDLAAGIDRAYGMEGVVEILNTISGIAQNLLANTLIVSTAGGQVTPPMPVSADEMPTDPDEGEPEPESEPEETEEEVEEEAPEVEGEALQPESTPDLGDLFVDEEMPVDAGSCGSGSQGRTRLRPGLGIGDH